MKRLFLSLALALGAFSVNPHPAEVVPVAYAQEATASAAAEPAAPAPADMEGESTLPETLQSAGDLVNAVRTGSWIGIAGTLIMLLGNLFRLPMLGGVTKKIPKRWRTAIPIVLGGVAGVLASILGGASPVEAIMVGVFTGPTAIAQHESIANLLMNKREKKEEAKKKEAASG